MRAHLIFLLFALTAGFGVSTAIQAQDPQSTAPPINEIMVGDDKMNFKLLEDWKGEVEAAVKRLAAVTENPPKATIEQLALNRELLLAIEEAMALMTRLDGAQKLIDEYEKATNRSKEQEKTANVAAQAVEIDGAVDEPRLERYRNEVAVAGDRVNGLVAELAAQTKRLEKIDLDLAGTGDRVAALQKSRAAIEAEGNPGGEDQSISKSLRAKKFELKIGIEEYKRNHHTLQKRVAQAHRTATAAELSWARAALALAKARESKANEMRQKTLEQEGRAAADAAKEKRREASDKSESLANRATSAMEAVHAELQRRQSEDATLENESKNKAEAAKALLDRILEQSAVIRENLPEDEQLAEYQRAYLSGQILRARARALEVADFRAGVAGFAEEARRRAIEGRDRMLGFRSRVADFLSKERDDVLDRSAGNQAVYAQAPDALMRDWENALALYAQAQKELADRPNEGGELETNIADRIKKISNEIENRINSSDAIQAQVDQIQKYGLEASEAVARRRAYLADIELWLKGNPLLSVAEAREIGSDFLNIGPAIRVASIRTTEFFRQHGWGFLDLLAFVAALVGLWGLRFVGQSHEGEAMHVRAWRAAGGLALFSLAGMLFFRAWMPENSLGFLLVALPAGAAVWRGLRAIARHPEVPPEEPRENRTTKQRTVTEEQMAAAIAEAEDTQPVPAWLAKFFAGFIPFLILAGLCHRMQLHGLGFFFGAVFSGWCVFWLVRAMVKTRGLEHFFPAIDGSIHNAALTVAWLYVLAMFSAIVLFLVGYGYAGIFVALRAPACLTVILIAVTVHAFVRDLLDRYAGKLIKADEEKDSSPSLDLFATMDRSEVFRRLLGLFAAIAAVASAFVGTMVVLEIDLVRLRDYADYTVMSGSGDQPGIRLGDLIRAAVTFFIVLNIARYVRDFMLSSSRGGHGSARQGLRFAMSTLLFYGLVGLGVVLTFRALTLDLGQLGWILAPAGVALGFGMTQILSNFVSGIILFLERPIQVGDIISVGDIEGDVHRISIRATSVRTRDGISIIIPNRKLIEEDVINWSHGDQKTRLTLEISVAYGSDVGLVKKILAEVAENDRRVLKRPRPDISFVAFGSSELQFQLYLWLASPDLTLRRRVRSDLNAAVDAAFRRHGVEIPFPQRDIHIRSTVESDTLRAEAKEEVMPKDQGGDAPEAPVVDKRAAAVAQNASAEDGKAKGKSDAETSKGRSDSKKTKRS